jgi:hypothetical protein
MKQFIPALSLLCLSANAAYMDGNILLSKINGEPGHRMQALGYIQGVHDAAHGIAVCSPENVTGGQVLEMTKNFLENVPAVRHFEADKIVITILSKTWPCVQKNNSQKKNSDSL